MRHKKAGWKLGRTHSHRKALLSNLATALLEHKKIQTTEAKAKALRPFVEKLISRAKNAMLRERAGKLPNGQSIDIHSRRMIGRVIRNKSVLEELFDTIAGVVEERPGGYTRIIKLGQRRGDGSREAIIQLVDWAEDQDGSVHLSRSKKRRKVKASDATVAAAPALDEQLEESVAAAMDSLEEAASAEVEAEAETSEESDSDENKAEA